MLNEINSDIETFRYEKNQFITFLHEIKKSCYYNNLKEQINKVLNDFDKCEKEYFKLIKENKKIVFKLNKNKYNKSFRTLFDNSEYYSLTVEFSNLWKEIDIYRKKKIF